MRLWLVRHADPDYASDALTPKGHVQARLLAEALLSAPIDAFYVSPLGRAQLTARYTLERRGASAEALEWLAELRGAYAPGHVAWDMHGVAVLSGDEPITVDAWPDQAVYGQQLLPVLRRFWQAWDRFCGERGYVRNAQRYRVLRHTDDQLAFFCHAGVILSLLAHLLHIPPPLVYAHFGCDPSSITILETDEADGWATFRLVVANDMSHAPGLRRSPQENARYGF